MKDQKDILWLRDVFLKLVETKEAKIPEIIRRHKFAVNLLDHVLELPTTFPHSDFRVCDELGGTNDVA